MLCFCFLERAQLSVRFLSRSWRATTDCCCFVDRSVRLWLLRDNGQYWPSVCHYMNSAATALHYNHASKQLFVGLDNGTVTEFSVSEDYNRMDHVRDYHAHQSRVTSIHLSPNGWLLSASRDRYFQFHSCSNGQRLGGYLCSAWCTALTYDHGAKYAFIGDYSGQITGNFSQGN